MSAHNTHPDFTRTHDPVGDVAAHFDEFAGHYNDVAFSGAGMRELARRDSALVAAAIANSDSGTACDIGVGTGRIVEQLLDAAFDVIGFDVSAEMREQTMQRFPQVSVHAGAFPGPLAADTGAFQLVTSLRVIKYVAQWQSAISEMARIAEPGGVVCFDLLNNRSLARFGYPNGLVHGVTFQDARDAIEAAGLTIVDVHNGVHLPDPVWRLSATEQRMRAARTTEQLITDIAGRVGVRSWGFVTKK